MNGIMRRVLVVRNIVKKIRIKKIVKRIRLKKLAVRKEEHTKKAVTLNNYLLKNHLVLIEMIFNFCTYCLFCLYNSKATSPPATCAKM